MGRRHSCFTSRLDRMRAGRPGLRASGDAAHGDVAGRRGGDQSVEIQEAGAMRGPRRPCAGARCVWASGARAGAPAGRRRSCAVAPAAYCKGSVPAGPRGRRKPGAATRLDFRLDRLLRAIPPAAGDPRLIVAIGVRPSTPRLPRRPPGSSTKSLLARHGGAAHPSSGSKPESSRVETSATLDERGSIVRRLRGPCLDRLEDGGGGGSVRPMNVDVETGHGRRRTARTGRRD